MRDPILTEAQRQFIEAARRAVLATIAPDGRPRTVPVCFALDPRLPILYTPIDEKPKATVDARGLARVRDLERDPRVAVLVDRWDEDWSGLGWVRLVGRAGLLEAGEGEHTAAVLGLRRRYAQYASHDLESRPVIRVSIARVTGWGAVGGSGPDAASEAGSSAG